MPWEVSPVQHLNGPAADVLCHMVTSTKTDRVPVDRVIAEAIGVTRTNVTQHKLRLRSGGYLNRGKPFGGGFFYVLSKNIVRHPHQALVILYVSNHKDITKQSVIYQTAQKFPFIENVTPVIEGCISFGYLNVRSDDTVYVTKRALNEWKYLTLLSQTTAKDS